MPRRPGRLRRSRGAWQDKDVFGLGVSAQALKRPGALARRQRRGIGAEELRVPGGVPPKTAAIIASRSSRKRSAMAVAAGISWLLALLPALLLAVPARGQGPEAFFEASGDTVRGTAPETRLYWRSHLEASRERILEAADLAGQADVATVLGSGLGMEIPLAELAGRFDRLILVDLDGPSMLQSLHQVPRNLRARVDLKVTDVTSFASRLIERIDHAVETSATASQAFQHFEVILGDLRLGELPRLPRSDLVVSSLLLSEIPRYPFSYAAQAIEARFGVAIQTWDKSDAFFRRLVDLAIEDHVQLLASLIGPAGVIYFSDTVARGPVQGSVGEESRRAVEAAAVPDFDQLGLADSAAGVAAAVGGLCRAEHAPVIEAKAFERILSLYLQANDQWFEPLLPIGMLRDKCAQRGLELQGSPVSWWWLAYPCQIQAGSGAFLVSNWILGTGN